jgi:predicted transposase YbfD/YdcC
VLALKGNQGNLRDDVELFFTEQKERGFADAAMSRHETLEKSHGRIETRTYSAIDATGWLTKRHGFARLKSIVMVESIREIIGGKTEQETRYYISSLKADAVRQGDAIRSHWGVESHHWVTDMVFRDDECRIRRDNAPGNFATIKHIASNLMRATADKHSMRAKRRSAVDGHNYRHVD